MKFNARSLAAVTVLCSFASVFFLQDFFLPTTIIFTSSRSDVRNLCVSVTLSRETKDKCLGGEPSIKISKIVRRPGPLFVKINAGDEILFSDDVYYVGEYYPLRCTINYVSKNNVITICEKANTINWLFG